VAPAIAATNDVVFVICLKAGSVLSVGACFPLLFECFRRIGKPYRWPQARCKKFSTRSIARATRRNNQERRASARRGVCKPASAIAMRRISAFRVRIECTPRGAYAPRSSVAVRMSADEKPIFAMYIRMCTRAAGVSPPWSVNRTRCGENRPPFDDDATDAPKSGGRQPPCDSENALAGSVKQRRRRLPMFCQRPPLPLRGSYFFAPRVELCCRRSSGDPAAIAVPQSRQGSGIGNGVIDAGSGDTAQTINLFDSSTECGKVRGVGHDHHRHRQSGMFVQRLMLND